MREGYARGRRRVAGSAGEPGRLSREGNNTEIFGIKIFRIQRRRGPADVSMRVASVAVVRAYAAATTVALAEARAWRSDSIHSGLPWPAQPSPARSKDTTVSIAANLASSSASPRSIFCISEDSRWSARSSGGWDTLLIMHTCISIADLTVSPGACSTDAAPQLNGRESQ